MAWLVAKDEPTPCSVYSPEISSSQLVCMNFRTQEKNTQFVSVFIQCINQRLKVDEKQKQVEK